MLRLFPILSVLAIAAILPPIPPLPTSSWPEARVAEPFATELMRTVPPADLARTFLDQPALLPSILRNLGTVVMSSDADLRAAFNIYMTGVAHALAPRATTQTLTSAVVVDPLRYGENTAFRERINQLLPERLANLPRASARTVIEELTREAALEFDVAEASAAATGLAPRSSVSRRVEFGPLQTPDDNSPIEASIYSLNSAFFTAAETKPFLDAVRAASPKRKVIVLGDTATYGRAFTPWPRDPFLVARSKEGNVVFVNRVAAQREREQDEYFARAIIDMLPTAIDAKWRTRWTTAPFFFHNGNMLVTPKTVWVTLDSIVLTDPKDLERFFGRPLKLVHPTSAGPVSGVDLDSIVTFLGNTALVGDIRLGVQLAKGADWSRVQREYRLRGNAGEYIAAQQSPRTTELQKFLDATAEELKRDGFNVRRLPLLNIPSSFVAREDVAQDRDFLITWNNVVLEGKRAEGFASLLTPVDNYARKTFEAAGFKLVLFPPLAHSVVLGGGYRCASNHVRRNAGATKRTAPQSGAVQHQTARKIRT